MPKLFDLLDLIDLIDADLKAPHAGGFGSLNIHTHLTLAQLDEVLKARPDLQNNEVFVNAYLVRLHPGADSNWKRDRKLALAFLKRLQAFAGKRPAKGLRVFREPVREIATLHAGKPEKWTDRQLRAGQTLPLVPAGRQFHVTAEVDIPAGAKRTFNVRLAP